MKITVLILTHNRPTFLHDCLESLKCQSRRDLIAEVILSENSANLESQAIADSFFDDLPIRYMHQPDKPTAREHGLSLLNHIHTDFVAIIADDDMWSPYHLQDSLTAMINIQKQWHFLEKQFEL